MAIALSDAQAQDTIIKETNALAASGALNVGVDPILSILLPNYWTLYAEKEIYGDGLQFCYTKRAVCDYLLGAGWQFVDTQIGTEDKILLSQIRSNLQNMRKNVDTELVRIETRGRNTLFSQKPKSNLPSATRSRFDEFSSAYGDIDDSVSGGAFNSEGT